MNKFVFILLLLIPAVAFGSSSRVLPDSYTEYTYDSAGGGEDYTSLATWEADTDIDCTTTGQVLTCSSGVHDDSIVLDGATTDTNGFRVIRASFGAEGTMTSGVRFVRSVNTSTETFLIRINESNSSIYNIAASYSQSSTGTGNITAFFAISDKNRIVGCTAYDCTASNAKVFGFRAQSGTTRTMYFINNVAINCTGISFSCGFFMISALNPLTVFLYNCTSIDNTVGLSNYEYSSLLVVYSKNCIIQDNSTNIYTYGTPAHIQSTNATSGVTFDADGYHLASNDEGAIDSGIDLSADGTYPFDDDIDGDTRTGTWDIGCDEYISTTWMPKIIIY